MARIDYQPVLANPYFEGLESDAFDEWFNSLPEYQSHHYMPQLVQQLAEVKDVRVDLIEVFKGLKKSYKVSFYYYHTFLALLDFPRMIAETYKFKRLETKLRKDQEEYVGWIEELVEGAKTEWKKTPLRKNYIPSESLYRKNSYRSKILMLLVYVKRTPQELVKYCVDRNISLNTLYDVISKVCSGKFQEQGHIAKVEGKFIKLQNYFEQ